MRIWNLNESHPLKSFWVELWESFVALPRFILSEKPQPNAQEVAVYFSHCVCSFWTQHFPTQRKEKRLLAVFCHIIAVRITLVHPKSK